MHDKGIINIFEFIFFSILEVITQHTTIISFRNKNQFHKVPVPDDVYCIHLLQY